MNNKMFSSVQSLSHVRLFAIPYTAACQVSLSITNSRSLSNSCPSSQWAMQLSHPLSSPSLHPSIFPSIRVFSSESVLHVRWPKYWSFSSSPSRDCSELISFMINWFDLLSVQGTLKSPLQHHSLKVSVLWCLVFFMIQHSLPYMTTEKTLKVWLEGPLLISDGSAFKCCLGLP